MDYQTHTHRDFTLTITSAVIDSFIQRFSSNRCPITIQAQRRATNKFIETTEEYSEVASVVPPIFPTKNPKSNPILANQFGQSNHKLQQQLILKINLQTTTSKHKFNHKSHQHITRNKNRTLPII
ncbi:hypothetical protein Hanom_Chr04g00322311 [Helianthus anomalus]